MGLGSGDCTFFRYLFFKLSNFANFGSTADVDECLPSAALGDVIVVSFTCCGDGLSSAAPPLVTVSTFNAFFCCN